jgi:hypothetical protein
MQKYILFRTDRYHKEVFGICIKDKELYQCNSENAFKTLCTDPASEVRQSYSANVIQYKELLNLMKKSFPEIEFIPKRSLSIKDLY